MSTQKPVVLKLGGKPFDLKPLAPSISKIIAHLNSCPTDELFTSTEICTKFGLSKEYILQRASLAVLQPYTTTVRRVRYVGNPRAIAELKRQTGGEK